MMPRNLDRRVEVMVPITNATVHEQILDQIMVANLKDNQQSWRILRRRLLRAHPAGRGRGAVQRARVLHDQSEPLGRGQSLKDSFPRRFSLAADSADRERSTRH